MNGRMPGTYLSIPNLADGSKPVILSVLSREDVDEDARVAFVECGYETMDTVYATLYQIAPNGGLAWSECFPINGPEA